MIYIFDCQIFMSNLSNFIFEIIDGEVVSRWSHKPKVTSSNLVLATKFNIDFISFLWYKKSGESESTLLQITQNMLVFRCNLQKSFFCIFCVLNGAEIFLSSVTFSHHHILSERNWNIKCRNISNENF